MTLHKKVHLILSLILNKELSQKKFQIKENAVSQDMI